MTTKFALRHHRVPGLEALESRRLLSAASPAHAHVTAPPAGWVAATKDVRARATGDIDILGTPTAQRILEILNQLAVGNQGHVTLDSLVLHPDSRTVSGSATIVAKHSWGSFKV